MKSQLAIEANPQADVAAADLALRVRALFAELPVLSGFVVEDLSGLHGDPDPYEGENRFVVTQISFAAPISLDQSREVCAMIVGVVADLIDEQPQAYELLRGRTFARTLH
jgi:hypothetical protein